MATTRLMPLHVGKGRDISTAIADIIDYVKNPQMILIHHILQLWCLLFRYQQPSMQPFSCFCQKYGVIFILKFTGNYAESDGVEYPMILPR